MADPRRGAGRICANELVRGMTEVFEAREFFHGLRGRSICASARRRRLKKLLLEQAGGPRCHQYRRQTSKGVLVMPEASAIERPERERIARERIILSPNCMSRDSCNSFEGCGAFNSRGADAREIEMPCVKQFRAGREAPPSCRCPRGQRGDSEREYRRRELRERSA